MLKITKIKLGLISDHDKYIFFEKGTRAVIFYIPNIYSKVKNKYLKSYNPKQQSKHIINLETNNLYDSLISKLFNKCIQMDGS